jgi:hypothetical protein
MFGPKRDDVAGKWIRLHKKELYDLYSPPNIIQVEYLKTEKGRVCSM